VPISIVSPIRPNAFRNSIRAYAALKPSSSMALICAGIYILPYVLLAIGGYRLDVKYLDGEIYQASFRPALWHMEGGHSALRTEPYGYSGYGIPVCLGGVGCPHSQSRYGNRG
jgi:hypothetical protein